MEETKKKPAPKKASMLGKFAEMLKKNKKLEIAFYLFIGLLVLGLYVTSIAPKKQGDEAESVSNATAHAAIEDTEARLAAVLSSIRGAGTVDVMITYDTGPELVTAMNVDVNSNKTETTGEGTQSSTANQTESHKPATVSGNGGTSPIILVEKQPAVRGVIVVADGAADITVRLNLQKAVQTVLDVPVQCIEVFERAS